MKTTAKDLRLNAKGLPDAVNRGEEVVITFRGKPCAKLIPYEGKTGQNTTNELFGIWKDNDLVQNVDGYVRELRKGRF
ncbi:MAG: type II toxin-antitoxin system prevent-host-death family antitoxin [Desulfosalsimonadaceae bacterium]